MQTKEFFLNIGPQHPSTHGVFRLVAKMDGEVIKELTPDIGFLHRSIEKICERRSYLQCITYCDRVDYVASMNSEWSLVLAIEKLAELEVPRRAEYIRIIVAELNRIASHLLWLGSFNLDLGSVTPFLYGMREREEIIEILEEISGNRLLYNYFRPGGVKNDIPEESFESIKRVLTTLPNNIKEYHHLITGNIIFQKRTKEVAIISKQEALDFGLSGPVLRASGVDFDIRKNETYSLYKELNFEVPSYEEGDCFSRYMIRMREMEQSLEIVNQCLDKMEEGPTLIKQPFIMRVPEGEGYFRTESARGEMGVYLVADGTTKPYRLKFRTASFANLQIIEHVGKTYNLKIGDLVAFMGSLDFVMPEVDR